MGSEAAVSVKSFSFDDIGLVQPSQQRKRVTVRGPVLTQSGYGAHIRMLVRWLMKKHDAGQIELRLDATRWGDTPWMLDPEMQHGFVGRMLDICRDDISEFDVSFQVQLPNEWDPNRAKSVNVGITAGVETDRCNPAWVQACNRMSMVIVPSQHTKSVFEASGRVTVPMEVVHESFPGCFLESPPQLDIDLPGDFSFLVVGQLTAIEPKLDRKRIQETIHWLCTEFAGDPSVGIVVKTNSGRGTRIDRTVCERLLRECSGARKDGFPHLTLVHGAMTDEEMHALYTHPKVKAYVTCTRGEGFGLPILEAAACGLPVVAPGWSGHMDFMSLGKFVRLSHELRPIPDARCDANIFMRGTKWADTSEPEFRAKVRKLRESTSIPRSWAADLKKRIIEEYSPDAIDAAFERVLGGLLL